MKTRHKRHWHRLADGIRLNHVIAAGEGQSASEVSEYSDQRRVAEHVPAKRVTNRKKATTHTRARLDSLSSRCELGAAYLSETALLQDERRGGSPGLLI